MIQKTTYKLQQTRNNSRRPRKLFEIARKTFSKTKKKAKNTNFQESEGKAM